MPRTTVDIDASVLRRLKARKLREGKTLGQLISELLSRALESEAATPPELEWISKPMKARVDLDDKDAVWRAIDRR